MDREAEKGKGTSRTTQEERGRAEWERGKSRGQEYGGCGLGGEQEVKMGGWKAVSGEEVSKGGRMKGGARRLGIGSGGFGGRCSPATGGMVGNARLVSRARHGQNQLSWTTLSPKSTNHTLS